VVVLAIDEAPTELSIRANLLHRVPPRVNFGSIDRASAHKRRFDVLPTTDREHVVVKRVEADERYFRARFRNDDPTSNSPWVELEVRSDAPAGGFDKFVDILLKVDAQEVRHSVQLTGWLRESDAVP